MQMKTLWEVFTRSCEHRGKKVPLIKDLDSDPRNAIPAPAMELSDYLILAPFFRGAHLGSTEIYNEIRDQLSYYRIFFPQNTASAVLPRLRHYARNGWLAFKEADFQSRAEGGSVFKFAITDEGRAAFRHFEEFYLRLAGFYVETIEAKKVKEIFPKPKP